MPYGKCRSLSSISGSLRTRSSTRIKLRIINSLLDRINNRQSKMNSKYCKINIKTNWMNIKSSSLNSFSKCLISSNSSHLSRKFQTSLRFDMINHNDPMYHSISKILKSFSHHPREHLSLHRSKQRYQTYLKWHRFKAMWSSTKKMLIENKRLMRDTHDLRN
jgi:hypothetical protein